MFDFSEKKILKLLYCVKIKTHWKYKIYFVVIMIYSKTLSAQLVNVESQRIQRDSIRFVLIADLSYSTQKNNDETFSFFNAVATAQYKSKSLKSLYLFIANADYAIANVKELSNSALFHFRYNYKVTESVKLEFFSQLQYNEVLDLRLRSLWGVGPRFKVSSSEDIKFYSGVLYMYEYEKTSEINISQFVFHRMSSYLSMSLKLPNKLGELVSVSYYQPRLDMFNDYRISNQTSLSFNLTSKILFSNTLNLVYDSEPPVDINRLNLNFTNGIKIIL